MKKSRWMTGVAAVVFGLALAGCSSVSSNTGSAQTTAAAAQTAAAEQKEATYVLKLHHDMSESTAQHKGAVAFKEEVEEKTNGDVRIDIFSDCQLGTDPEAAEMMQSNIVQCGLIPTAKLSGMDATMQLLDLPFLCSDRDVFYQVLDDPDFRAAFYKNMENIGLKGISVWESGYKQFTANSELTTPDSFKGLKFRTMESPLILAQFEALGANPRPIDFGETYNALQNHTVDGQENPLVSIVNMKFYEVQKNMTLSNHAYLGYAFLFSKDCWDSLPAEYQEIIQNAANSAAVVERQLTVDAEDGYIQQIKDAGVAVNELSADNIAALQAAEEPVYAQFRDVIGGDLIDLTQELIKKYSAQ